MFEIFLFGIVFYKTVCKYLHTFYLMLLHCIQVVWLHCAHFLTRSVSKVIELVNIVKPNALKTGCFQTKKIHTNFDSKTFWIIRFTIRIWFGEGSTIYQLWEFNFLLDLSLAGVWLVVCIRSLQISELYRSLFSLSTRLQSHALQAGQFCSLLYIFGECAWLRCLSLSFFFFT